VLHDPVWSDEFASHATRALHGAASLVELPETCRGTQRPDGSNPFLAADAHVLAKGGDAERGGRGDRATRVTMNVVDDHILLLFLQNRPQVGSEVLQRLHSLLDNLRVGCYRWRILWRIRTASAAA